jgi:hypothetical protein
LTALGYAGYFNIGNARRPTDQFDAAQHQNPANIGGWKDGWAARGVYVNNFMFFPTSLNQRADEAGKAVSRGAWSMVGQICNVRNKAATARPCKVALVAITLSQLRCSTCAFIGT